MTFPRRNIGSLYKISYTLNQKYKIIRYRYKMKILSALILPSCPRNQIKDTSSSSEQARVQGGQASSLIKDERGEDSVGAKMMKLMGWTEGSAIGDRFKVRP
jgi:hypothetical protein